MPDSCGCERCAPASPLGTSQAALQEQAVMQAALERVYSGDQGPEADAVLDALEDAGWKVVPA